MKFIFFDRNYHLIERLNLLLKAIYFSLTRERSTKIYLLTCVCIATCISFTFYPGCFSSDSLSQYQQALTKEYNSWHPVIMSLIMRILNKSLGPGGILFFHQYIFWISLFLIITSILKNRYIYLLVGFLPHIFLLNLCVWKDVGMNASMLFSLGCLMQFVYIKQKKLYLFGAFIGAWYATLVRLNGFTISFLFIVAIAYYLHKYFLPSVVKCICIFVVSLVFIGSFSPLLNYTLDVKKMYPATPTLLHDIAGITYYKDCNENKKLPINLESSVRDEYKYIAINSWYTTYFPSSCGSVCWGKGMFDCAPKKGEQFDQIINQWKIEVKNHPVEYLKHRSEVFIELLQFSKVPYLHSFKQNFDNDEIYHPSWLADRLFKFIYKLYKNTYIILFFLIKPYTLLLLNLIVLLIIFVLKYKRKFYSNQDNEFLLLLSLSNCCSSLGLYFSAPAEDYRYNIFMLTSSIVVCTLLLRAIIMRKILK